MCFRKELACIGQYIVEAIRIQEERREDKSFLAKHCSQGGRGNFTYFLERQVHFCS